MSDSTAPISAAQSARGGRRKGSGRPTGRASCQKTVAELGLPNLTRPRQFIKHTCSECEQFPIGRRTHACLVVGRKVEAGAGVCHERGARMRAVGADTGGVAVGQTGQYGCMVDGCPERFATLGALGPHMWRGHSDEWKSDPTLKAAYDALKASERAARKAHSDVSTPTETPAEVAHAVDSGAENPPPTQAELEALQEDLAAAAAEQHGGDVFTIGSHDIHDPALAFERPAVDNPVEAVDSPPAEAAHLHVPTVESRPDLMGNVTPFDAVQQMRDSALELGLLTDADDAHDLRLELIAWLERLLRCWFVPRAVRIEARTRLYELTFEAHRDATLAQVGDQ